MKPLLLLDKSSFQSLSRKAAHGLFRHFSLAVPDVLVSEILADRAKKRGGEQFGFLVRKFENSDFIALIEYRKLVRSDLLGHKVPMDGTPITPGVRINYSGGRASVFERSRRQQNIQAWIDGVITEAEDAEGKAWRDALVNTDPEGFIRRNKDLPLPKVKLMKDALGLSNSCLNAADPGRILKILISEYGLTSEHENRVIDRWIKAGKPLMKVFAPYAAFCLKVQNFFSVATLNGLLGTRKSNILDLRYLFYLPFSQIFCSADNLHEQMAPLLLRRDQEFLDGKALRSLRGELEFLHQYWNDLNPSQKKLWSRKFGCWPPSQSHSIVFRCWKKHALPRAISGPNALTHLPPDIRAHVFKSFKEIIVRWRIEHGKEGLAMPDHVIIKFPRPFGDAQGVVMITGDSSVYE